MEPARAGGSSPAKRAIDAALRELREESGIEAEITGAGRRRRRPLPRDIGRHYVLIDYAARLARLASRSPAMTRPRPRFLALDDGHAAWSTWDETRRIIRDGRKDRRE
jgi:8-oxo-dGTP diphosphatase